MKKRLIKKISAIIITAALMCTTVFSATMLVSAAGFSPRLSAPSYDNGYYYSSRNIFYSAGYGMPNCTCYAFGRAYEILGTEPKLSHGNAENWYGYNMNGGYYNYGSTPKVGAIACWSYPGGGGHVAVVEKVENGTITLSNSAWSGINFYVTTASVNDPVVGGNSWWNFQGYIYILDSDSDSGSSGGESYTPAEPKSTDNYPTGTYKVNVDSTLNMRSGAGTSYGTVASIPDGASINVTDVTSDSNYVWGYTTYKGVSGWTALDYCNYVSEPEPAEEVEETTQPAEEEEEQSESVVEPEKADDSSVGADSEDNSTAKAEETTTQPEEKHDYVLYIANENSEETVVYPLSSSDQNAEVTLKAGNYLVYMQEDGETVSSTYELVVDAKSDVSVTYDISTDYFLIICNPTGEDEAQPELAAETEDTTVSNTEENSASITATPDSAPITKVSTNDTSQPENGAIKTGQDVQAIAVIMLALSIGALSFMFVKRRMFF